MRKHWHNAKKRLQRRIFESDRFLINLIKQNMTLIAAVIGLVLFVDGFFRHDPEMSAEVVLAGAFGYWFGFSPAVVGILVLTGMRFAVVGFNTHSIPLDTLIWLSCLYIAWLGREHRLASNVRKLEVDGYYNTSQEIPWSMVNEVRNSLLAMRLLLFNRHHEAGDANLRLVEDELTRLDNLFHNLDDNKQSYK